MQILVAFGTESFPHRRKGGIARTTCSTKGKGVDLLCLLLKTIRMFLFTEIVTASDQIHTCLKREHPTSSMTGFACECSQPLPEGSIQALDKSRVEDAAPLREREQPLGLSQQPMRYVETIIARPIQAIILPPFTRISSV